MRATDVRGAIALAEGAIAQRALVAVDAVELPQTNVFGHRVAVERGADMASLLARCGQAACEGERVTVIARAEDLATCRGHLARIAAKRLGVVVHCIADHPGPGDPQSASGTAAALSLGDLPWGMLVAVGVAEAHDLALVARRAAEDSGCPFFVVHEGAQASTPQPIATPTRELCEAFLGGPRPATAPPGGDERAVAERVPFALGSALRELESLTARRQDVILRSPAAEASLAVVGLGLPGDSMLGQMDRVRAAGHDVAAVRVVAWRPFPGPRLVKSLARALAVSVVESVDRPLVGGGPLTVELKAAFADAITWAPGYPGIGRVPRIASGLVAGDRGVDAAEVDEIVANMLADERGKRTLVLGARASA
jgi:pyruvate ferredoxin oxidoreductase alpha subunit